MAKPINLYQGPAPAAMGMMGQGILEAGANIGRTLQGGYESLGKNIASGISSVAGAYKEYKDEQAKFDATKKVFKAFGGDLNEDARKEIDTIFADTSMSVREKNALAPTLMQFLGVTQQQKGREKVAEIMTGSREAIAAAKNPPRPLPQFDATQTSDPYKQVAGQTSAEPALPSGSSAANPQALQQQDGGSSAPYMIQRPPAQPQPVKGPLSNMPKTRQDPKTDRIQFWSPGAKRYIDETENELLFGPDLRITPF